MEKISHGHLEYFNCKVRIKNTFSSSSDRVFNASAKGRNNMPFHVGMACTQSHYETIVHAKLALFFVLCKRFSVSVEEYFLVDTDIIVLTPTQTWQKKPDNSSEPSFLSAICCVARLVRGIFVVDLYQLKRMNEDRDRSRLNTLGKLRVLPTKRNISVENMQQIRRDNLSNNLQMEGRTITLNCASFIETAQKYNLNQIPINSDRVEMSPIGLKGWLKSTVIYQAPRNSCGSKTRKCYFYFTPKFRKKFRSLKEVEKYRKILQKHNENERAALAEYAELTQT